MKNIVLISLLLPLILLGQRKKERDTSTLIYQPNRIEFLMEKGNADFQVVSGKEDGLMVVSETGIRGADGGFLWNVHLLDTALQPIWNRSIRVENQGSMLGYEYHKGTFYLLFTKNAYRVEDLVVYQFSKDGQEMNAYEITTVFPVDITHFETVGETLLIAGYANYRPVVITFDINERTPRVLPGFYDNRSDILDIAVDDDSRLFTVIQSERMRNKRLTVRVKTFTARGELIQDNVINPGDKRSLIDAASTTFAGGLQYLAGTQAKRKSQYSQGFYLSKFINGKQQLNKYYPFADLNNFFGHLKPKREKRIKNRIDRKRAKGKIKKFSYRLLVHDILERDGEYIMIAEAYYPRYNYSADNAFTPFTPVSPYARGFNTFNPFFLGYKYTHAVVVAFDANCNILWDQTFKIDDIQIYELEKNVMVSAKGDRVVLMYVQENELRSKVVEKNEVLEGRTYNPIRLSTKNDVLKNKDPEVEGLEQWYDGALYAYGEQSITTLTPTSSRNRRVFYINKIQYDLTDNPNGSPEID